MTFGVSYVGLIFLIMLFAPNILWSKNKPVDYEKHAKTENKILSILESIGQVLVVCFSLIFTDFNINGANLWTLVLIIAFSLMILYEIYWIRYFRSPKRMSDMYTGFLGIPVAGATLPFLAFLFLGIYGKSIFLIIATIILGIGRIGIIWAMKKSQSKNSFQMLWVNLFIYCQLIFH